MYGSHCVAGERSYVVTLPDGTKTHVPVWLTEPEAADAVALTETPFVSVSALLVIRALLDRTRRAREADDCP